MVKESLIIYSFILFSLSLLLPIVPSVIIYRLFPDSRVTAEGPLRGLSVKTSGAFGAYLITVLLGAFLTTKTMTLIENAHQAEINPASKVILNLHPIDQDGNPLPPGALNDLQPMIRLDPEIYRIGESAVELDVPGSPDAYTILIDIPGFGQRRLIEREIKLEEIEPGLYLAVDPIDVRQAPRLDTQ